jgi:uncharacterized protein involved in type VI secretion and phage assembly
MSEVLDALRAVVRSELARYRLLEIGAVTQVFAHEAEDGAENHQVNVKLQGSGVELPNVPVAVARPGLSLLPRVDDLVAVSFVGGDLNAPIVLGTLYDDTLRPPQGGAAEVVYKPPDEADSNVRRVYVELPSGTKLTWNDDTLTLESGGTEVMVARDGDVTIKAKGKISLTAEGDIELSAQGNLKLSAQGDAEMSGTAVKVEGSSSTKVSGAQLTLAGTTQFSAS